MSPMEGQTGALPPDPGTGLAPTYHPTAAGMATSGHPSGGSSVSVGASPWSTMTSTQSGYVGVPQPQPSPFGMGAVPGLGPDPAAVPGLGVPHHATGGWPSGGQPVPAAAWQGFPAPYVATAPAPGPTVAAQLGAGPAMFHAGALHTGLHPGVAAAYGGVSAPPTAAAYLQPGLGAFPGLPAQPPFPGFPSGLGGWPGVPTHAYPGFPAPAAYPAAAGLARPPLAPHAAAALPPGHPTYATMQGLPSGSVALSTHAEPSTSVGGLAARDLDISRASAHSNPSVASLRSDLPAPLASSPRTSASFQDHTAGLGSGVYGSMTPLFAVPQVQAFGDAAAQHPAAPPMPQALGPASHAPGLSQPVPGEYIAPIAGAQAALSQATASQQRLTAALHAGGAQMAMISDPAAQALAAAQLQSLGAAAAEARREVLVATEKLLQLQAAAASAAAAAGAALGASGGSGAGASASPPGVPFWPGTLAPIATGMGAPASAPASAQLSAGGVGGGSPHHSVRSLGDPGQLHGLPGRPPSFPGVAPAPGVASGGLPPFVSAHPPAAPSSRLPSVGSVNASAAPTGTTTGTSATSAGLGSIPSWLLHAQTGTMKVVVTSGGAFARLTSVEFDYSGGETRLVTVPVGCDLSTLRETLARVTRTSGASADNGAGRSGGEAGGAPHRAPVLKYKLPSDPSVWVDMLDDEDVQMMFDEWAEFTGGRRSAARLHLFLEWQRRGTGASAGEAGVTLSGSRSLRVSAGLGRVETVREVDEDASSGSMAAEALAVQAAIDSEEGAVAAAAAARAEGAGSGTPARRGRRSLDVRAIMEKMELIMAEDVTLVRFLGSGGYGDVYLGRWHSCEVAVKCLAPSLFFQGGDTGRVNRAAIADLIREADMLGSMRHPNIVWVYGLVLPELAGAAGGDGATPGARELLDAIAARAFSAAALPGALRPPALVAEYMAGGSLKGALARHADMVAGVATRVMLAMDTAKGMAYLHAKNIIHFDLKSGNLLLGYRDKRPVCKVADFGLSKQKVDTYVSGVTSQRGTLPYTAPEVIRTPNRVTEKADVFSFGVIMWELWTGREPYENLNYHALMHQLAMPDSHVRPPLPGAPDWDVPGEAPPELAPGWRVLLEKCWADDPDERPSFPDIVKELRNMVGVLRAEARSASARLASNASG
ncbi:hypothetical protein ACKKBG_A30675 [Auxenochlorella protothecoides x Auxenochlorella symbiontica]